MEKEKEPTEEETGLYKQIDAILTTYPNFPTQGILFRDIMPIFQRPELLERVCLAIASRYRGIVDAVAALESRGFLFGPTVAINLKVPFVPIRKAGKLPGIVQSETYVKEYGQDTFEIQPDGIDKFRRILLLDDLLATGGSLLAGSKLLRRAGAELYGVFVLVELTDLKGRELLKSEFHSVYSALKY